MSMQTSEKLCERMIDALKSRAKGDSCSKIIFTQLAGVHLYIYFQRAGMVLKETYICN